MPILIVWCGIAASVLIVSLVVHTLTYFGIDPTVVWPQVMVIHLAIFPPFIAALWYANNIAGPKETRQHRAMGAAPIWLRVMANVFAAYAAVNFVSFMILSNGGGVPSHRDGKYFLHSHSHVLRDLTEAEYHQQQAYIVRGFSGHWMLFSCGALMMLVGVARLRSNSSEVRSDAEPDRCT